MSPVLSFSSFTDVSCFSSFSLFSLFSLSLVTLIQVLIAELFPSQKRLFYLSFTFLLLFSITQVQGRPQSTSPHLSGVHTPHNERANNERTNRYAKDQRHVPLTHLTPSSSPSSSPRRQPLLLLLHPSARREKREKGDVGERAAASSLKDKYEGHAIPDRSPASPLSSFPASEEAPQNEASPLASKELIKTGDTSFTSSSASSESTDSSSSPPPPFKPPCGSQSLSLLRHRASPPKVVASETFSSPFSLTSATPLKTSTSTKREEEKKKKRSSPSVEPDAASSPSSIEDIRPPYTLNGGHSSQPSRSPPPVNMQSSIADRNFLVEEDVEGLSLDSPIDKNAFLTSEESSEGKREKQDAHRYHAGSPVDGKGPTLNTVSEQDFQALPEIEGGRRRRLSAVGGDLTDKEKAELGEIQEKKKDERERKEAAKDSRGPKIPMTFVTSSGVVSSEEETTKKEERQAEEEKTEKMKKGREGEGVEGEKMMREREGEGVEGEKKEPLRSEKTSHVTRRQGDLVENRNILIICGCERCSRSQLASAVRDAVERAVNDSSAPPSSQRPMREGQKKDREEENPPSDSCADDQGGSHSSVHGQGLASSFAFSSSSSSPCTKRSQSKPEITSRSEEDEFEVKNPCRFPTDESSFDNFKRMTREDTSYQTDDPHTRRGMKDVSLDSIVQRTSIWQAKRYQQREEDREMDATHSSSFLSKTSRSMSTTTSEASGEVSPFPTLSPHSRQFRREPSMTGHVSSSSSWYSSSRADQIPSLLSPRARIFPLYNLALTSAGGGSRIRGMSLSTESLDGLPPSYMRDRQTDQEDSFLDRSRKEEKGEGKPQQQS